MKTNVVLIFTFIFSWSTIADSQVTIFDSFIPQFRLFLDLYLKLVTPSSENAENIRLAKELNWSQLEIKDNIPFPCSLNNTRSRTRPESVHALRPGDIDIIGALGDSLTAGNGILATNFLLLGLQNRGLSFTAGGQSTWRKYVTLPNILKEFNPNLIGYATRDSFVNHNSSQFNVAEAGAMSNDLPFMANVLVNRLKSDPRINITRDWKMISIMMGDNDFCLEMCYQKNPEILIDYHQQYLITALRTLRDNLPRTIVNLILTPHLKTLRSVTRYNRPSHCVITQTFFCPCLFGESHKDLQSRFDEVMSKYQDIEEMISNLSEFDTDKFTVVLQTFTKNFQLGKTKDGLTDYSSLSSDCFHLTQKEHAKAATALWNNLLEPVGNKSEEATGIYNFKCPTIENPYIFTRRNSKGATQF